MTPVDSPGDDGTQHISLFLRIPRSAGNVSTIVKAHREVLAKNGSVWFGIMGRALSAKRHSTLAQQLCGSEPTFLYLAQLLPDRVEVFRGRLTQIATEVPQLELHLSPGYYAKEGIVARIKLWAKIASIESVKANEIHALKVSSTGSPITKVLGRNMCSLMSVTQ
jgi:hypothetical protein